MGVGLMYMNIRMAYMALRKKRQFQPCLSINFFKIHIFLVQ